MTVFGAPRSSCANSAEDSMPSREWQNEGMDHLHAADSLADLAAVPGNHLEALAGDRAGQHSIRINDQWRICFEWKDGEAFSVEIVDD